MNGQMGRRRAAAAVRGLTAMITLLLLVIGLPAVLYRFGGNPVPHRLPSLHQAGHALLRRDNGSLFLAAVRDISWLSWALFSLAVATEAIAAIRGQRAPRLRLGGLQNLASQLVALVALTFSSPATALLAAAPAGPVVAAIVTPPDLAGSGTLAGPGPVTLASVPDPGNLAAAGQGAGSSNSPAPDAAGGDSWAEAAGGQSASPPAAPQVMSMASYQAVVVRPGECLWTIAQRYLGDGDLFYRIVQLNVGHEMGGGQVFRDPALIMPGWVLQLPAAASHGQQPPPPQPAHHPSHPSRDHRFSRPHPAASQAGSPGSAAAPASGPAGQNLPASRPAADPAPLSQQQQIPPIAVFAAGMLTGGVMVAIARMRHQQRQARMPGRRIPMPASAPVMAEERRLRAVRPPQPATALRTVLDELGAGLAVSGQQLPDVAGIHLTSSAMEILLASPASEPPPPPFSVPGGRQGMAWHLALPDGALPPGGLPDSQGDLLPGLLTAGVADDSGGYLLVDLEHLRVTTVDGPPRLVNRVLATAATELATSELAGWYDLIICGYGELEVTAGRAKTCDNLDEALDLLAAKAVTLQRRLGDGGATDVRFRRIAEPDDEDWALSLLVSRVPPTAAQLSFLADIAGDPGGIAALVAGQHEVPGGSSAPASFQVSSDPDRPGGIVAQIFPMQLEVRPQALTEQDYVSIVSLFETAALDGDVAPDLPPYDGASWTASLTSPGWPDLPPAATDPRLAGHGLADDGLADDGLAGFADDGLSGLLGDLGPGPDDGPGTGPFQRLEAGPDGGPASLATPAGLDGPGARGRDPETDASRPADAAAAPAQTGPLRIGILGSFTINGASGALLPAQSQLILALALNGPVGLSNPQLGYLLGADPDHPKLSDSLRQLIARTRRQLGRAPGGGEWIVHLGGGQYSLHPDARFDWTDFSGHAERGLAARDRGDLREALALVRGQPFTGCYHWWLDLAFVETVRAQIVDVAELLAALELAAGDPSASARAARAGLAGDVAAEQLWRALMRAEHVAGNLSGVREAWQHCLGAIADIAPAGEPHPDTAALYQELLRSASRQPAPPP
jgi:DNA-binding SARP family transcriptional activator